MNKASEHFYSCISKQELFTNHITDMVVVIHERMDSRLPTKISHISPRILEPKWRALAAIRGPKSFGKPFQGLFGLIVDRKGQEE